MTANDKRPRRRRLNDEERALWHGVTRSVAPLKGRRAQPGPDGSVAALRPSATARPVEAAPTARAPAPPKPPPLAPFDRRLKQRLARGAEPVDARIDLHGKTQSQAHTALLRFLHRAQADGARTVLVITGKGAKGSGGGSERGVLRRQVPLWLSLPELRGLVLGFEDAHAGHGGEGALYVRLRRGRSS